MGEREKLGGSAENGPAEDGLAGGWGPAEGGAADLAENKRDPANLAF